MERKPWIQIVKGKHLLPLVFLAGVLIGVPLHAQIFVANTGGGSDGNGTIGEYTTAGAPVGSGTLEPSGLNYPEGIAVSGSDIFVANYSSSTIGEYTTAGVPVGSGTLVSSGLNDPWGIAVVAPVPEPSTWALVPFAGGLLIARNRRRHRACLFSRGGRTPRFTQSETKPQPTPHDAHGRPLIDAHGAGSEWRLVNVQYPPA
jgi:hypothetical protein